MRFTFITSVPILVLALASNFLLEPVAAASRLKGRGGPAARVLHKGASRTTTTESTKPKRRKLSGKGKGGGNADDDFYRFPCEFCGEGNDSALGGTVCFSKDMTVDTLGRGILTMEELQVGDKVLTQNGVFQSVYSFGHHNPDQKATFVKIHSDNGHSLELTPDHLVYLADKHNPVRAKSVKVGDTLKSSTGTNQMATVRKIEKVQKTGVYAPLTLGGNLVVNGVLASSYISLQDMTQTDNIIQSTLSDEYMIIQGSKLQIPLMSHQLAADIALSPYRAMCRVFGSRLCDTTKDISEGMPLYIKLGRAMTGWASPNSKVHPMFLLTAIAVFSPFWLLEKAVFLEDGAMNFSFLAVVLLVTFVRVVLKRNRVCVVARKVKTV